MNKYWSIAVLLGCFCIGAGAQTKHSSCSQFPSYEGRVMCGYQGWFRAPGDGQEQGWGHYTAKGKFDSDHVHLDFWPDVLEYEKTYATALTNADGSVARVFSSADQSTTDLHFKWMRDYGIDGVFVQRFFDGLRTPRKRKQSRLVLENAIRSSQKYGRAISVMYDLSGLKGDGEDCTALIDDWKELVDELKITSQSTNDYLYHRGKPLVAIWGIGFPDRSYNIHKIGLEKVIDFLKNDPQYGGCAVMLGVPTYFRDLKADCLADPYVHKVMEKADVIMPWMVGRFTPLDQLGMKHYSARIKEDISWCEKRHLDYVPCVYPGFSWYNLSKVEVRDGSVLNQIPRQKGAFYWSEISKSISSGAKMLYIAMFDEMDEGTAIFKCSNNLPVGPKLCDYENMPSDYYLRITGEAGKMLRKEIPFSESIPNQISAEK